MCAKYLMLHLNKAFFYFCTVVSNGRPGLEQLSCSCAPADRPERGRRHGGRLIDQLI